jgi:hypothetical protein
MKEFVIGRVYFTVSFVEPNLVYPIVDAYVYVGVNLLKDEAEDTWYFQDTGSYAEHGAFTNDRSTDAQIMTFTTSRLDDVLDVTRLCEILTATAEGRLKQLQPSA